MVECEQTQFKSILVFYKMNLFGQRILWAKYIPEVDLTQNAFAETKTKDRSRHPPKRCY